MNTKLWLFTCTAVLAPALFAETYIYSNSNTDLGTSLNLAGNGLVAAGSHITFDPLNPSRYLTTGQFQVYNEDTNDISSDATLSLYHVSGNVLGSAIGVYSLGTAIYTAGSVATLNFSLPYVVVPDDIVWTLSFTNPSMSLNYFDPPTIGSSAGTDAWWDTGSGLTNVSFPAGAENYNADFLAESETPEPATLLLTGCALASLLYWRRRLA